MDYYSEKLSAEKLKHCYEIAPQRVKQYLEAELNNVLQKIKPGDLVLDLGCGYGRTLPQLADKAKWIVGIDISLSNLVLAQKITEHLFNCLLIQMDASNLYFPDRTFDAVICIQNGISAFHVDKNQLIKESIRVIKYGGTILFSSYAEKFWKHRLEWFQLQSDAGLIGEIDFEKTKDGNIVCKDGFTASTVTPEQFYVLISPFSVNTKIYEVDESCVFCEMVPLKPEPEKNK
jgi:ubiquinone/menaquinone biosynthesis C-methylase UbiE